MKKHLAFPNRKFGDGILIDEKGYVSVAVPEDYAGTLRSKRSRSSYKKYVLQHRLVMEKKLGRYLKSDEIVHHKNGIKYDNREKNLELIVKKSEHHIKKIKCPKCGFNFKISGKYVGVN